MIPFFIENLATILISLGLAGVLTAIIVSLHHKKKKGKGSCGCSCSSCPMSGSCHK